MLLQDHKKYVIATRVASLNQLGIIWTMRDNLDKARSYLEQSLAAYFEHGNIGEEDKEVYLLVDLLKLPDGYVDTGQQARHLELLITHTYYYLAQVGSCQ